MHKAQYETGALLHRTGATQGETVDQTTRRLLQGMPEAIKAAGEVLLRNAAEEPIQQRPDLWAAARWMDANGETLGARRPDVDERGSLLGAGEYWAAMREILRENEVHDAQGRASDPRVLAERIGPRIEEWTYGGEVGKPRYPTPAAIQQAYHEAMQANIRRGQGAPGWPKWTAGHYEWLAQPPTDVSIADTDSGQSRSPTGSQGAQGTEAGGSADEE